MKFTHPPQVKNAITKLDRCRDNRQGFAHVFAKKPEAAALASTPENAFKAASAFATRRFGFKLW